jgi:hypothetical protein
MAAERDRYVAMVLTPRIGRLPLHLMEQPVLTRCQCGRANCALWVAITHEDADVLRDPSCFAVAAPHLHPAHRMTSFTPQYALVYQDPQDV